jgi:hypothetical protein
VRASYGLRRAQTDAKVLAEEYGVPRFRAQALQEQAGKRAGMVAKFCQRMGWAALETLIARLQVCRALELVP